LVRPVPALGTPEVRLLLVSATILFTELLLIRWIPANIRYIGFFPNFLLIASFLGIGVGILIGRRSRDELGASPFAPLLFAVVVLVANTQLNAQVGTGELVYGLYSNQEAANVNFIVLPLVVVLTTLLMAALALPLGPLLRSMPPLRAYAVDITGSLAGIAAFTALSAAGTPPTVWFTLLAAALLAVALGRGLTAWSALTGAAMVGVLYVSVASPTLNNPSDIWSPYHRITRNVATDPKGLLVNGIGHQVLWRYDDPRIEPAYEQVYKWFPGRRYERVLIIGAGTGSDVAMHLHHGASHVDAVEIDPLITSVGRQDHPNQPYDDPRVTVRIDDGRNFLRNSNDRYDLIVFGYTDSLTVINAAGNLRLESYLYTLESLASVRDHLTSDGVFVMYNWYDHRWLVDRLGGMLTQTFASPPIVRSWEGQLAVLANGPAVAALGGGPPPGDTVDHLLEPPPVPATDDWPFPYLREPQLAMYHVAALGTVILFAILLVAGTARATLTPVGKFSPHFFVLGVAFLLLETRSLATFALLFGSTWLVNALVFFAILLSVLVAVLLTARVRIRRPRVLYAALLGSLLVAYLLPPEVLLIEPPWLRYLVASVLAFAPIFMANLVFTYSFRDTRTADMSFASNIFGAMVGGAIEYVSVLTGYRALLVIAGGLYGLALLFATRIKVLGDRELEAAQ
jgi:SAM-dependent methyltransferase